MSAQPADVLAVMDARIAEMSARWQELRPAGDNGPEPPSLAQFREARAAVAGLVEVHAALLAEYGPNICSMRVDAPRRALWLRASTALARVQWGAA